MEKRYVATITIYTYGETPEEALKQAEIQCGILKNHSDNHARIEKFHYQPFGTLILEELDIYKLNNEDVEVF